MVSATSFKTFLAVQADEACVIRAFEMSQMSPRLVMSSPASVTAPHSVGGTEAHSVAPVWGHLSSQDRSTDESRF